MLTTLLETLLSNAVTVTVLAVVVFALAKFIRHQGIVHGLWIVVLVKLITPSIIALPFAISIDSSWLRVSTSGVFASFTYAGAATERSIADGVAIVSAEMDSVATRSSVLIAEDDRSGSMAWQVSSLVTEQSWSHLLVSVLILIWLLGTCVYVTLLLARYVRFCRFLKHNEQVNEELISEGYDLAYKMGLKRPPRVRVLSGAFSPMLCGLGRGLTLILPLDLLHRLTPRGRATLIVHELAHYSRGDYLVRVLETVVTALYWWHPVVWWVCRELEIVEEDCCDARVVAEFPGEPRHYAEAILDAIDILCERSAVMPPLASGLGAAPLLKHRLTRIMTETPVPVTTRRGYVTVLACGAIVLPLQMIHFRPEPALAAVNSVDAAVQHAGPDDAADLVSDQQLDDLFRRSYWCRVHSPNGNWSLLVNEDQPCRLASFAERRIAELPDSLISCVVFSPDSQFLAAGTSDGRVLVFRAPDWRLVRKTNVGAAVKAIDWSSKADRLAVCTDAGDVRVLNAERLNCIVMRRLSSTALNCLRFSHDSRTLIVGCGDWKTEMDSALLIIDSSTLRLTAGADLVSPVVFARFGQREDEFITCDWSGQLTLWSLPDLMILSSQWIPKDNVAPMAFSVQADDNGQMRGAF